MPNRTKGLPRARSILSRQTSFRTKQKKTRRLVKDRKIDRLECKVSNYEPRGWISFSVITSWAMSTSLQPRPQRPNKTTQGSVITFPVCRGVVSYGEHRGREDGLYVKASSLWPSASTENVLYKNCEQHDNAWEAGY